MKKIPIWIQRLFFFLILFFLFFFPLPFYLEVPGNIFPLSDMIEVNKEYEKNTGEFYITTVGVKQATPLTFLQSFLPYQDLVSESKLLGDFEDFENYNTIQKYYMNHSINNAIKVAFDEAEKEYKMNYKGVYVLQVIEESNFYGQLKIGDIVEAVDQQRFESSSKFMDYIASKEIGEKIELAVNRSNEKLTFTEELIELESGGSGIGIALTDNSEIETDPEVKIHSADIGGPSAGLMFAIDVYTQLMNNDLSKGYKIAGTGSISPDGEIGRIGGIEKKIVAADREKADYFLAPDDQDLNRQSNYDLAVETAEKIRSNLHIVPVKTFEEAVEFLNNLEFNEAKSATENSLNYSAVAPLF